MNSKEKDAIIYGSVTVGERGQVVIPVDARQDLKIKAGDKLLVFRGHRMTGLSLIKTSELSKFIERMTDRLSMLEKALLQTESNKDE